MQTHRFTAIRAGAFALALTAAAVAAPALAERGGEEGSDRMLGKMTRHLELDTEQQASVASLMAEAREAGAADRERMQEIKTQLRAQADSFDAGATQALADELGAITARSTYRMTETRAAMHELLNEEQRGKLDAMESKRGEKWRKHGKGGHREADSTQASDR